VTIRIGELDVDASITEEHKIENEGTEYPVEEGAKRTDHLRQKPVELSIEGVVSDTPLKRDEIAAAAANGVKPSEIARAELERMFAEREPVPIVTALKRYDSMMPLTLTITKSKETFGGLFFTATFREFITVTNAKLAVRVATVRAKGKPKLGSRPTPSGTPTPTTTRCVERDPKTGVCLKQETLTAKNGQWCDPSGRPLSPEELTAWSVDQGTQPGHEAEFDPAQGTWVDKRTNQPVSKYPDRAYWDETGLPVQNDKPTKDKLGRNLTPTDGASNGFWDSMGQKK